MRRLACLAVLILLLCPGCARTPSGLSPGEIREVAFRITLDGPVNDSYYYMIPIDVQGGSEGPRPVFLDPDVQTGDEWVTGNVTYYVEYTARRYLLYRVISLNPLVAEPAGTVLRPVYPSAGSATIGFSIDLNELGATGDSIDLNVITLSQRSSVGRLQDGLGLRGSGYINLDITTDRMYINGEFSDPEEAGDVLDQNGLPQPENDQIKPLDITGWAITVDV